MSPQKMNAQAIRQTLEDAKCDEKTIREFLKLHEDGKTKEAMRLLSCYRCHLVCAMHEAQKPVDIMDYLIYQLEKEQQ